MNIKKYQKYFVLSPRNYEKLKLSSIDVNTLSELEKKLLLILKSRRFSTTQKLILYKQALYGNLENLKSQNLKKAAKNIKSEASLNKNPQMSDGNFKFTSFPKTVESFTQTPAVKSHSVETETNFPTIKDDLMNETFEPNIVFSSVDKPVYDIYKNDADEIDWDAEQQSIIDQIEEAAGTSVDVSKLNLKDFKDPRKETVRVYLPEQNLEIDADKSEKLIEYQKKSAKSKTQPSKRSPYSTRQRAESEGDWMDYGSLMKNQRI